MLRSICVAGLLLLGSGGAPAADAIKPCAASWACIGMAEMQVGETSYRMSRYANSEMLADIDSKSGHKRYLVAQPSGTEWYFGLSPQEIATPGSNPFAFFDYMFALPVAALRMAFPDGPAYVPESPVLRELVVEGNPVAIRASRQPSGRIDFRLEIAPAGVIEGQLDPALLPPLDENYSMSEWRRKEGAGLNSLKEARSAVKP